MIRIAVCDDDADNLIASLKMIEKWAVDSNIPIETYQFDNGDALINKNNSVRMDIIFLDIIMPLLNGMDTAKELRQHDKSVKIIFLTSSPEFALESYEVKAHNYLIKPITYQKIKEELDDCMITLSMQPKHLILKTECGYQKIFFHDIEYIEAQNKKVIVFLRSEKCVEITEPLYTFENRLLKDDGFFKCHRSYLVYIPNVDYFNSTEIKTKSGRSIPIARGYGKAFQEAYFMTMFRD